MNESRWIRAGLNATTPLWGLRDGIQAGIWPASIESDPGGGPRGLLRIGYPIREDGKLPGLVNFIAVEPIVKGQRGYSELERSDRDGQPGRLIWSGTPDHPHEGMDRGRLVREGSVERLQWTLYMERFANGARPQIELEIRSDRPGEVRFKVGADPDSAPMQYCILTATMGNYMRLRRLHLKDGVVHAKTLWPDFQGEEFTPDALFPLERLPRAANGDLLICATTDEINPGSVPADPRAPWWRYRGSFPVTQYWRRPSGAWHRGLRLRVNARRLYWASHNPIPGGISFENFELMEPYAPGQTLVFGLSRQTPERLLERNAAPYSPIRE